MIFSGWDVTRAIPQHVLDGLLTGQYKLYGGVIRWAAGTQNAGQIVAHLVPASSQLLNFVPGLNFIPGIVANMQLADVKDIVQNNAHQLLAVSRQMGELSQTTQKVLQVANTNAVFSGLGLAVSCIGFMAMIQKLNAIENNLKTIQKDVQAIQQFLETSERARLFSAISSLLKLDKTPNEHRHTILHNARQTLADINVRYRDLLPSATTIEVAMAYEEYFVLTALSHIRCTAELGMLDMAHHEAQETQEIWQQQSRRITKDILLAEYPERFLASDFVDDVSITELVEWLDFAHAQTQGYGWIDQLRRKLDEPWYNRSWLPIMHSGSGLNRNIGVGMEKEQSMFIPSIRKLIARNQVLEGYVAQYEFLATENLVPSAYEQAIAALPKSSAIDDHFILEPAKEVAPTKSFFSIPFRSR